MERSIPTTAKSKAPHKYIPLLIILPFLVLPSIILLMFGEIKWGLITLALFLPVLIILVMGMLMPRFTPPRLQEILNHLTEDERRNYNKMGVKLGLTCGLFSGLIAGSFYPVLQFLLGAADNAYYIIPFAAGLLFAAVFGTRGRKIFFRFALTTEYAKEKGWDTI